MTTHSIDNFAELLLGAHADGTPVVHVALGAVAGQTTVSTVHEFTSADLVEDLAAAFAAAADHLRTASE